MRTFTHVLLPLSLLLLLCLPGTAAEPVARPNIVMLFADDLGWADLSTGRTSYGNGSKLYQTPHIDRLAAQGMAFTSAYAYQNC